VSAGPWHPPKRRDHWPISITFVARSRQAQRVSRLQIKGYFPFRLTAMRKRYDDRPTMAIEIDARSKKSL
jgi:hypothetical protein